MGAEVYDKLPWEVAAALGVLGFTAAFAGILLLLMWYRSAVEAHARNHVQLRSQPWLSHEDDGEVHSIPMYPYPPEHITRWGMHSAHVRAGKDTERGCPVCYTLHLHLRPSQYVDPFRREKES